MTPIPNPCFSNPRHPNLDPKTNRKSNLEIDMKTNFVFDPKVPKKLSEWVPKIIKKSIKSKPGPHRVLPCALHCPKIVAGSSQGPPGRQSRGTIVQACQMTPMGTINLRTGCKNAKNPAPRSQQTFQQRSLIKQKPTNENLPNQ